MKNEKGFTLIELLAVIIILGVLMLVAIPSVTTYINNSKKSAYIDSAKKIIDGAIVLVNSGELDVYDTGVTYYIPKTCINTETGGESSPYARWKDVYVIVAYNGDGYEYYWASTDEAAMGINITYREHLTINSIETGIKSISTNIGVGSRDKIIVFTDCKNASAPIPATEFINDRGDYGDEGTTTPTNATTTTDNVTWTNNSVTITMNVTPNCDDAGSEYICNATLSAANSDTTHKVISYSATFTVPSGTRIEGGPYTPEIMDANVNGTTLTIVGNKDKKKDRFLSAGTPLSTGLRIAYPKSANFGLSNGNITYNYLSDDEATYETSNLTVKLTRTDYWNVANNNMRVKYNVSIRNKTGNTLTGWSFRLSSTGLVDYTIHGPLAAISSGTNYVIVGTTSDQGIYNLGANATINQDSKIELTLTDINSQITIS